MIATFGSLRRAIACGLFATATVFLGGCFQVEDVADQAGAADATAAGGEAEPELSIAMGDEAGPLDLNVDATVGEVSSADFAPASFGSEAGSASEVPDAPTAFAPSSFPPAAPVASTPPASSPAAPSEFAPTSPAPTSFADAPSAPVTGSGFAPAAPALASEPPAAPALQPLAQSATEAPGVGFEPTVGATDFQPAGDVPTEGIAALRDQEQGAPVEPMEDPEHPLANVEPTIESTDESADEVESRPETSALAEDWETTGSPGLEESPLELSPSPSPDTTAATEPLPANEPPASAGSADPPAALVETTPAVATEPEEAASEAGLSTAPAFAPPTLAVDASETRESVTEVETPTPVADPEVSSLPEVASTTPFEEEEFAPLFGPGRRLADASAASEAPATIPTPGPALDPDQVEAETPSVLAQERPSPAAEELAMQIVDPSAPPPASLRPTAQPNAALPAFDPTIGDRLTPPVTIDEEDYKPTPPGTTTPGTGTPGPVAPGPASSAPRAIPMPGPARDDESEEAVPAPPATGDVPGSERRTAPSESTSAEIADAARDWTDASGSHTLKAAILEYDKGEVRLETPKGERYRVSLSSLSRYDQGYVKGLAEGTLGKEAPERTWTDSSGEFSLQGSFVESDGDLVRIAREDGKTFKVEKRQLASYDRGYVDGLADAVKQ